MIQHFNLLMLALKRTVGQNTISEYGLKARADGTDGDSTAI